MFIMFIMLCQLCLFLCVHSIKDNSVLLHALKHNEVLNFETQPKDILQQQHCRNNRRYYLSPIIFPFYFYFYICVSKKNTSMNKVSSGSQNISPNRKLCLMLLSVDVCALCQRVCEFRVRIPVCQQVAEVRLAAVEGVCVGV